MTRYQAATVLLILCLSVGYMPFVTRVLNHVSRRFAHSMAEGYVPGSHSMAFVTVPSEEVARKIAGGLVKNKLAACVNVIPGVKSIYEWEGKIEEDSEMILMIKSRTSKIDEISKFVRENHPYDVAEVISSPIENGNPPYLKWIGDIVPERDTPK